MSTFKNKIAAGGLALILATTAVGAFAKGHENGDKGERRGNINLDYIYTELALTEEQQADVNAVLEAFRDQTREELKAAMDEIRNAEERPSREEMAEMREAHRAELIVALTDELSTVLSADQAEDLVTYIDAHSPRGPHGGRRIKAAQRKTASSARSATRYRNASVRHNG